MMSNPLNIFIGTNSFQADDMSEVDAGQLTVAPNFTTIEYTVTTHLPGSYLTDMLAAKVGMAVSVSNFTDFTNAGSARIDDIKTYQHTGGKTLDFNTFPDIGMSNGVLTGEFDPSVGSDNIIIDSNRQVAIDTTLTNQVASALPKALGSQMPLSGGKDDIFRIMVNETEYTNLAKFAIKDLGAVDVNNNNVTLQGLIHSASSNTGTGITYNEIDQAWYKTIDQRNVGHEILSSIFHTNPATPDNTNTGVGATWEHENDDYLTLKRLPQNVNLQFVLKTELSIVNDAGVPLVGTSMSPSYATGQTSFDSTQPSSTSKRVLILYNFMFNETVAPTAQSGTVEGTVYDGLVAGANVYVNGEFATTTSNVGTYTLNDVSGVLNIEVSGGTDLDTNEPNDLVMKLRIPDGGNATGMRYVTPITTVMAEAYEQDNNVDEDLLLTRLGLTDTKSLEEASKINPDQSIVMRKSIMNTVSMIKTIREVVGDNNGAQTARAIAKIARTEDGDITDFADEVIDEAATRSSTTVSASDKAAVISTVADTKKAIRKARKVADIVDIHTKILNEVAAVMRAARAAGNPITVITIPEVVVTGNVHALESGADCTLGYYGEANEPILRFNGETEYVPGRQYSVTQGTYRIKNIPASHAICMFSADRLALASIEGKTYTESYKLYQYAENSRFPVGDNVTFMWGDVDIICSGEFSGSVGLVTRNDYECGCASVFVYDGGLIPPGTPEAYPATLPAVTETKTYNVYQWPYNGGDPTLFNDAEKYTDTSLTWASANIVFVDMDGNEHKVVPNDNPYDKPSTAKASLINGNSTNISVSQITLPADRTFRVLAETNPNYVSIDENGFAVRLPNYVELAIEDAGTGTIVHSVKSIREESGDPYQASFNSTTARFEWKDRFISDGTVSSVEVSTTGSFDANTGIVSVTTTNNGALSPAESHCSIFRLSESAVNVLEINSADKLNSADAMPQMRTNFVRTDPITFTKDGTQYWLDMPIHNTGHNADGLAWIGKDVKTLVPLRQALKSGDSQQYNFDLRGILPGKYAVITDGPWWTQNPESYDLTTDPGRKILTRQLAPTNAGDMANSAFVFEVPETVNTSTAPNYFITARGVDGTGELDSDTLAQARCHLKPLSGQNDGKTVVLSMAGKMNLRLGDGSNLEPIYPQYDAERSGTDSFETLNAGAVGRSIYLPDGEWEMYHTPEPLCKKWNFVSLDEYHTFERFVISKKDPARQNTYRFCYQSEVAAAAVDRLDLAGTTGDAYAMVKQGEGNNFNASSDSNVFHQYVLADMKHTTASNVVYDSVNSIISCDVSVQNSVVDAAKSQPMGLWKLGDANARTRWLNDKTNEHPDLQIMTDEYFFWDANGNKRPCEARVRLQTDSPWPGADYNYSVPGQPNTSTKVSFSQGSDVKLPPGDYLLMDRDQVWIRGRSDEINDTPMSWNSKEGQRLDSAPGEVFTVPQYSVVDVNPNGGFSMSNVQTSNVNLGDRLIFNCINDTNVSFKLYRDQYRTKEVTLDGDFAYEVVGNNTTVMQQFPNFREYRIPQNISTGTLYFHGGSITISDWVASEVGNVEGYTIESEGYSIDRDENIVTESNLLADDLEHVISA